MNAARLLQWKTEGLWGTGTDEEVLAEFQGREKETEVIDLEGKW